MYTLMFCPSHGRKWSTTDTLQIHMPRRTYVADDLLDRVDTELVDTVSAGLTGDGDLRVVDTRTRNTTESATTIAAALHEEEVISTHT